jgi:hypothetical protein
MMRQEHRELENGKDKNEREIKDGNKSPEKKPNGPIFLSENHKLACHALLLSNPFGIFVLSQSSCP